MSSPNNQRYKPSRVSQPSTKPIWRRKTNHENNYIATNDFENQQALNNTIHFPHNSPNIHPSTIMPSFTSQPPLNNNGTYHFGQSSSHSLNNHHHLFNISSNQITNLNHNPTPTPSPSPEHIKFVEELKEAHEHNALRALNLAQTNFNHHSTIISTPNTPLHDENHVNNCRCCNYSDKRKFAPWIEYLLTRSLPTFPNPHTNTYTNNSPIPNTPYLSPTNN